MLLSSDAVSSSQSGTQVLALLLVRQMSRASSGCFGTRYIGHSPSRHRCATAASVCVALKVAMQPALWPSADHRPGSGSWRFGPVSQVKSPEGLTTTNLYSNPPALQLSSGRTTCAVHRGYSLGLVRRRIPCSGLHCPRASTEPTAKTSEPKDVLASRTKW